MLAVLPSLEWVHTAVVSPVSPERYHGFVLGFLLKEIWGRDGREERDLPNRSTGAQVDQNWKCPYLLRITWTQSALKGMWLQGPACPGHGSVMVFQATFMEAKRRMAGPTQELWSCYGCPSPELMSSEAFLGRIQATELNHQAAWIWREVCNVYVI